MQASLLAHVVDQRLPVLREDRRRIGRDDAEVEIFGMGGDASKRGRAGDQ